MHKIILYKIFLITVISLLQTLNEFNPLKAFQMNIFEKKIGNKSAP